MKISEHIAILQAIQAEHGDIEVMKSYNVIFEQQKPTMIYLAKQPNKKNKRFFDKNTMDEKYKGEKVCRI